MELLRVLDEATGALVCLDADALTQLECRALRLQAVLTQRGPMVVAAEIVARQRVFARVVEATGENLRMMERVSAGAGEPWAR